MRKKQKPAVSRAQLQRQSGARETKGQKHGTEGLVKGSSRIEWGLHQRPGRRLKWRITNVLATAGLVALSRRLGIHEQFGTAVGMHQSEAKGERRKRYVPECSAAKRSRQYR